MQLDDDPSDHRRAKRALNCAMNWATTSGESQVGQSQRTMDRESPRESSAAGTKGCHSSAAAPKGVAAS